MHWPMTTKFGHQRQRWRAAANGNKERWQKQQQRQKRWQRWIDA